MNKIKSTKGITLISLVVTIIILLIIAGVSINLLLGENGIIKRTGLAKEEYENVQIAEQESLNEAEKQLADYNKGLPDNTPNTEAGTSNITLSTGINFASKNTASSWINDNFSVRDGL